jgi:hypothetical protein
MRDSEQTSEKKLTAEECVALADTMRRKYSSFLKDRYFELSVRSDRQGTYATVLLRNERGSFYYPVEGRIADIDHHMSERDAGLFLIDYIDSYFEEFFRENGEVYLPIDWASFDWEGVPLQLKGQILNLEAEQLADRWLESGGRGDEQLH